MNAEEKYQAELKQSDLDHHQPTAAAMTGDRKSTRLNSSHASKSRMPSSA